MILSAIFDLRCPTETVFYDNDRTASLLLMSLSGVEEYPCKICHRADVKHYSVLVKQKIKHLKSILTLPIVKLKVPGSFARNVSSSQVAVQILTF